MKLRKWLIPVSTLLLLAAIAAFVHSRRKTTNPSFPTVGKIHVKDVKVTNNVLQVGIAPNNGFCAIELAGGIHVDWQVELERVGGGAPPADWGTLALVQNVDFHHRRTLTKPPPPHECVGSANWALDGQYPYLNQRVTCAAGTNRITLADDPNVPTESGNQPYETVEVAPVDQFRTYVIWEITDDNFEDLIGRIVVAIDDSNAAYVKRLQLADDGESIVLESLDYGRRDPPIILSRDGVKHPRLSGVIPVAGVLFEALPG